MLRHSWESSVPRTTLGNLPQLFAGAAGAAAGVEAAGAALVEAGLSALEVVDAAPEPALAPLSAPPAVAAGFGDE
jgi:hypothetical protein